jgi:putative NADPH-quinone reductase
MGRTQNILIVVGHPSARSLSHKLAAAFMRGAMRAGKQVTLLDVYRLSPKLPLQDYQDYSEWDKDARVREHYQRIIADADKIVFFHPIWWGSMPPLLKNFIDQTFTPGFAFRYRQRRWVPRALNVKPDGYLRGKKAHVFITYDGYTLGFLPIGFPFITVWAVPVFYWCGITRMRFTLHQRTRWANKHKRSKWLKRAERQGERA